MYKNACVMSPIYLKWQQKRNKKKKYHIRNNSFVDDQLTFCPSLYFVSKFKSWKYVLMGKKHVIYHDIVQEIKKHTVKSFVHIETFLSL